MKLFISHAKVDEDIAKVVKRAIKELPGGPECFLLVDDIFPADDWEKAIKKAAEECDEIVCIATPDYIGRPWFVAEWAVFWFQDKPWTLLTQGIDLDTVFEPMRRLQIEPLDDRRRVKRFLEKLTETRGAALENLAEEVVQTIADTLKERDRANGDAHLVKLAVAMTSGTDNVSRDMVERVRRGGRLPQAVATAVSSSNSLKMRQFAVALLDLGEVAEAARVAAAIPNRAERRTVGVRALSRLCEEHRQDLHDLVLSVYSSVRNPQRRDLREAAENLDIDFDWPTLPDAP